MNLQRLVFFMLMICLSILPYLKVLPTTSQTISLAEKTPKPSYKITPHAADQAFLQHEYKTYPGPIEGLLSASPTWTGFFRQKGRDIHIDFGNQNNLNGLSIEFRHEALKGILLPEYMDASISIDGQRWSRLGRVDILSPSDDKLIHTRTLSLVFPPISTRYVKLSFPVEQWAFARRLSFQMEKSPSLVRPTLPSHFEPQDKADSGFLNIQGIHDVALIYTGDHGHAGKWSKEDFMPMLAYLDPQGQFRDQMFDTFLFLPYPTLTKNWKDWKAYLDDLFASEQQLHALNEASKSLNKRTKVILTLAYPVPHQQAWDPLSPTQSLLSFPFTKEGKEERWKSRQSAMETYFEQVWTKWNQAHFSHLELVGFYWLPETIDPNLPQEVELVQSAAQLLQQKRLKFFWIPYFGSSGYDQWKTYGFDYVMLQPNYYATLTPAEDRMENAARIAKEFHLGMELELDERILNNRYYYDLFYKQLNQAKALGLDQAITYAYYLGGRKTVVQAAKSPIPQARQIYDDLYKWMKGDYSSK